MSPRRRTHAALAAELADRCTVVLYDRRGRGESTDTQPFAVDREMDDVAALIAATGPVFLLGISSWGALALRAAAALGPDRVSRVGVFEPPFLPETMPDDGYADNLERLLRGGDRDGAIALFLARVGLPEAAIDRARQSPGWTDMTAIAPTLGYDAAGMGDGRAPRELVASLGVPVLAIAGGNSPDFMQHGARVIAETAADGRLVILAGQGHDADPSALAATMADFIVGNEPGAGQANGTT